MAAKKLPTYEVLIGDPTEDNTAVDFVALVDDPAIMKGWMKFSEQSPYKFEVTNTERRIITGPLMIADLPIYRRDDERGEYNVVFRKDNIEKIVKKWGKGGFHNNVNRMHDGSDRPSGVYLFESIFVDKERGVMPPKQFDDVPDGSWFASYYVENDEVWNQVKDGTFKGFSVECFMELAMSAHNPNEVSELERGLIALAGAI